MKENKSTTQAGGGPLAQAGTHVVLDLIDDSGSIERLEFDIVADQYADFAHGFLGESTAIARAIMGKPAGSLIEYQQADISRLHILEVGPALSKQAKVAAQERQDAMRKAAADVERTNAILFASSFSGKWGDYDPSGMEHWEEKKE